MRHIPSSDWYHGMNLRSRRRIFSVHDLIFAACIYQLQIRNSQALSLFSTVCIFYTAPRSTIHEETSCLMLHAVFHTSWLCSLSFAISSIILLGHHFRCSKAHHLIIQNSMSIELAQHRPVTTFSGLWIGDRPGLNGNHQPTGAKAPQKSKGLTGTIQPFVLELVPSRIAVCHFLFFGFPVPLADFRASSELVTSSVPSFSTLHPHQNLLGCVALLLSSGGTWKNMKMVQRDINTGVVGRLFLICDVCTISSIGSSANFLFLF